MYRFEQQALLAIAATILMSYIYFFILDRIRKQIVSPGSKNAMMVYLWHWRSLPVKSTG